MKPPFAASIAAPSAGGAAGVTDAAAAPPFALLPTEKILWAGCPRASDFARHVLQTRAIALYFAVCIVVRFHADRSHGSSIPMTLGDAVPLVLLAGLFLLACHALALGWARSSRYFVTSERCVLHVGLALTGTLSLPWRRVAGVALALRADGSGDIALAPKRPHRLRFVSLWPHVRPWRIFEPEPMLRCVADAKGVADAILAARQAAAG